MQGRQRIERTGRLSIQCPWTVEKNLLLPSFNSWFWICM